MSTGKDRSIPERLGRYRIVRPLSKGGMALVYEGRREIGMGASARVAIKVILPDLASSPAFRELFAHEAQIGAAMRHQNLVQILDFDEEKEIFYLVMEYVDGLTVSRTIGLASRHDVPISSVVIAEIGRQACEGLHYAHSALDSSGRALAMVHRDIKPSNLILTPEGMTKVLDFGIAKGRVRSERRGSVRGTWGYMAPEQAVGERLGPNADVFALGIVLYEMASRRSLFKGLPEDRIRELLADDHGQRAVSSLEPAYEPLVPILRKALARVPEDRFASAAEMAFALGEVLPDPVTTRDAVADAYRTFHDLNLRDRARPPPPADPAGPVKANQASMPAPPPRNAVLPLQDDREGTGTMLLSALVGLIVVFALTLLGWVAWRWASPPAVADTPLLDVLTPSAPPVLTDAAVDLGGVASEEQGTTSAPSSADAGWLSFELTQPAEARVDGVLLRTPSVGQAVTPGVHQVLLQTPDGVMAELTVTIEAGKHRHCRWDVNRQSTRCITRK